MTKAEFSAMADALAREAGVQDGIHSSFLMHRDRLWTTLTHFDLWKLSGKKVLELGAFYSYTPFIFRQNGNEVTVLEGDDPVVYPLKPLYAKRGIEFIITDFIQTFGEPDVKKHRFPFPDDQFDMITCWETMEHFNFNPVGFVKDIKRILRPGGIATLTVPNRAKLHHRLRMIAGNPIGESIEGYYQFYGYAQGFMGWHWREYTLQEFSDLFAQAGFQIVSAAHLTIFQNRAELSATRKLNRALTRAACAVVPSLGTNCAVIVRK